MDYCEKRMVCRGDRPVALTPISQIVFIPKFLNPDSKQTRVGIESHLIFYYEGQVSIPARLPLGLLRIENGL
jgi:hypothetical protein